MPALALRADASLEEVEAALHAWEAVAMPRQAMQREQRSIEGIQDDLKRFEEGVAIASVAAPELADTSAPATLARLHVALTDVRRAEHERERLQKAAAARAETQAQIAARRAALAPKLDAAMAALGVGADALADALQQAQRRQQLLSQRAAAREDLRAVWRRAR